MSLAEGMPFVGVLVASHAQSLNLAGCLLAAMSPLQNVEPCVPSLPAACTSRCLCYTLTTENVSVVQQHQAAAVAAATAAVARAVAGSDHLWLGGSGTTRRRG